MVYFKNIKSGNVVEVSEEFAEQVLIPQGHYLKTSAPIKETIVEAVKSVAKKKSKKSK